MFNSFNHGCGAVRPRKEVCKPIQRFSDAKSILGNDLSVPLNARRSSDRHNMQSRYVQVTPNKSKPHCVRACLYVRVCVCVNVCARVYIYISAVESAQRFLSRVKLYRVAIKLFSQKTRTPSGRLYEIRITRIPSSYTPARPRPPPPAQQTFRF
ncbi:hypothetical protein EVAR_17108_1 [Eumeta japonica]|uniref:Uncharacterized protein n=1 Tax=Eumeta variegata TaxID=151549 RepID=A0A4C1ULU1_EUMVA|nr:hypothetical protein EVAR_17108_1 [Eumeta japonica]